MELATYGFSFFLKIIIIIKYTAFTIYIAINTSQASDVQSWSGFLNSEKNNNNNCKQMQQSPATRVAPLQTRI